MITITIEINDKAVNKLSAFVEELGGKIISITEDKHSKKAELLNEIKIGLSEVKSIREGKSKSYNISDLLE